jgi:septal ring factor EnvC (AmiA/AmiB activator)
MKRILAWFLISSLAVTAAQAQESATQQEIDKLSGQIQDMEAAQAAQEKRISALERQITNLSSQLNQIGNSGFASQDDLQKLAQQVQEIDKKRQEDNERVLKELEHLEKALGASPPSHNSSPEILSTPTKTHSTDGKQTGYDYTVHKGDTISAIAKAYRDQGIKVTTDEILKANPGLDPKNMKVGQKVFIPAPAQ